MQRFSSERSQTASLIDVRLKDHHILYCGTFSYGSMSGRDLMAVTIGLDEVTKQSIAHQSDRSSSEFRKKLHNAGVPLLLTPRRSRYFSRYGSIF
jgi:tryptophanase